MSGRQPLEIRVSPTRQKPRRHPGIQSLENAVTVCWGLNRAPTETRWFGAVSGNSCLPLPLPAGRNEGKDARKDNQRRQKVVMCGGVRQHGWIGAGSPRREASLSGGFSRNGSPSYSVRAVSTGRRGTDSRAWIASCVAAASFAGSHLGDARPRLTVDSCRQAREPQEWTKRSCSAGLSALPGATGQDNGFRGAANQSSGQPNALERGATTHSSVSIRLASGSRQRTVRAGSLPILLHLSEPLFGEAE